ncbi:MAG: ATP-binding cassette domain-containing protein [Pelolinea sp.]|nr:ATP-binding cassette domain-containing protein [Pelolinea sp.]
MKPLLQVIDISKSFGTLPVIKNVSMEVFPGEVVGLTGSTGSGKSVLMMLLAGLYEPNFGEIIFDDVLLEWPFSAQSNGIGVIHQKPTLAEHFDITSNIFLGNEIGFPERIGLLRRMNRYKMREEAIRLLDDLGMSFDSFNEEVYNLSGEQRQMIAIARVLTFPLKMVIIDEPTVSLGYPNQQKLLNLIQEWQHKRVSVIFSSNNLDHLFSVTDRIVVLRKGIKVADHRTDETSKEEVLNYLLGIHVFNKSFLSVWDFDSYDLIREKAEKISYHQMLLEKDLAAEGTLNRQLTEKLADQLQTLEQTNQALLRAQQRLLSEGELERKHLAREIHDQIIQDLLSINYELEGLNIGKDSKTNFNENVTFIQRSIRELIDSLRHICGSLRPPTIDSLGIGAAIKSYAKDWEERTKIDVNIDLDTELGRLPESIELSIFRIFQEGLNNVWKHAHATKAEISLHHTFPRTLLISISDNGLGWPKGFDISNLANKGHFGLTGISERVAFLGGRLHLQHQKKGGALITAEIPHPKVKLKPRMIKKS